MNNVEELKRKIIEGIATNLACKHEEYNVMLDQVWRILFETTSALRNSIFMYNKDTTQKSHATFLICQNCLLDAHAAFQSLRSGFDRAAAIVIRGILENLSLAIVLKEDESGEIFDKYVKGEYDIPRAISSAKKLYPYLGQLYGKLSKTYVHEHYEVINRSYRAEEEPGKIPKIGNHDFLVEAILLAELGLLIEILGHVIEWSFSDKVKPSIFLEPQSDGKLKVRRDTAAYKAVLMLEASRKARFESNIVKGQDEKS